MRAELKSTFASNRTKSISWRQQQLLQLARLVQDNAEAIADALHTDLGKPRFEVFLAEIAPAIQRSVICAQKVAEWAKDEDWSEVVGSQAEFMRSWRPRVRKEPKGIVLIIACVLVPSVISTHP